MPVILLIGGLIAIVIYLIYEMGGSSGDIASASTTDLSDLGTSQDLLTSDLGGDILSYNKTNYENYATFYALKNGLDPSLVKGIIQTESSWNPDATSNAGAQGLMQLMPQYFGGTDINLYDPEKNIQTGTAFLASLLKKYPLDTAIQMYNVGEQGYLNGARASDYLNKVLTNQKSFA